ncbi:hypothetical protein R2R35_01535 [Anaerocolumna sp. AGMB13020]|uniref:hypothetical protein n=1 Tax=Anaerocolumna sp. AGMB13020 TaxID=3081750 RepID=UPI002954EDF3|nr:hypothetical protein [Anaerocolumna sp. AGMB13020]WOO37201.1 hypothetical protein R2R35_01535 [Anaerocolumna sp. AGMB13020]
MLQAKQSEALCPIGAYPPSKLNESTNEIGQTYNLLEIQQIVYTNKKHRGPKPSM